MSTTHTRKNPAREIIDTSTRRRIAAATGADERTVDKVILGQPVRGDVGIRILTVLAECGIAPLEPAEGQA